ncbi:MAG: hypothetical protein LQ350_000373 [Teloschistes chrysophthalmus]|nr:MAG: hypothetical protein LQ350_000373 [Niorma chrysophthalma]
MKALTITTAALLALAPSAALAAVCNADNVLRALRGHSAQASPFCSTYTLPPPNQPLPTYVSAYPASRVSSACSCFITPTPTTLTTSTTSTSSTSSSSTTTSSTSSSTTTTSDPSSTPNPCQSDVITNGDFHLGANGKPDPWVFSPATRSATGSTSTSFDEGYAYFSNYGTTSIKQAIPGLCRGTYYVLTYTSQIFINGGQPGALCRVSYTLDSVGNLVYIGPNGSSPPFSKETRTYGFYYNGNGTPDVLTIQLTCNSPSGSYIVDDVHLVGSG